MRRALVIALALLAAAPAAEAATVTTMVIGRDQKVSATPGRSRSPRSAA